MNAPHVQLVEEEQQLLAANRQKLLEHPVVVGARDDNIVREMARIQQDIREAKEEDKGAMLAAYERLHAILRQLRSGRREADIDPDSPYFAHLRIDEEHRSRHLYLGRATRLDHGLRIVDWRNAPISRIFYLYREGEEFAEEMGARVLEGLVGARRTVSIQRGDLMQISAPQGIFQRGAAGDWARLERDAPRLAVGEGASFHVHLQAQGSRRHLGGVTTGGRPVRADKHLPDIAALIDPEQFRLITRPDSGAVVVRGGAGSGKTTVALHRVAYLAYQDQKRFRGENMLVLVWGKALRDYIGQVLPSLGVRGVPVRTWGDWASDRMRAHFNFLPRNRAGDTPEVVSRLKLHPGFLRYIDERLPVWDHAPNARGAVDDWLSLLSDLENLAGGMERCAPGAFTRLEIERVWDWHRRQRGAVQDYLEGERETRVELDPEDDALLLCLYQLRAGRLHGGSGRGRRGRGRRGGRGGRGGRPPLAYTHLVIDEVQDLAPIELKVILSCLDRGRSVTLAGDTQQHIMEHSGFTSWEETLPLMGLEPTDVSSLQVSYRSTRQIMAFARHVLGELAEDRSAPTATREGAPIEMFRFTDHGAAVAFLADSLTDLMRVEPNASVALVTPGASISRVYYQGLMGAEVPHLRLVEDEIFAFEPGIEVTEITEVKGLEFDYVVLVEVSARAYRDDSHHRRLLHVGCTRAAHQLWLTSVGSVSPLVADVGVAAACAEDPAAAAAAAAGSPPRPADPPA